ncbi:hypothetical protein M436DRAFT_67099 [Aureobasidium namibiae CBS 147.97]|uniref:Uncharacterized protein n=1 Tax=Aureobasidium namibiae CBS 147.97 TaxID=1043004 RepID=A0A074WHW1_9PEZI
MLVQGFISLVFLLSVAAAAPVDNDLVQRAVISASSFCKAVNAVVTAVNEQSSASAFCSSYLSIPVVTTETTSTRTGTSTATTAVTTRVTTITVTVAATVAVSSTSSITNTVTTTATIPTGTTTVLVTHDAAACKNPYSASTVQKRTVAVKQKPACLGSYSIGAVLSSACSCLSVPTSTTTVVLSTTSTATVTITASILGTTITTTTATTTTTDVVLATTTLTVGTTVLVQATVTSTAVTGTFQLVATGDPTVSGAYATNTYTSSNYVGNNVVFSATQANGELFSIAANGNLVDQSGGQVGNIADTATTPNPAYVFINPPSTISENGFTPLTCTISVNPADGTCPVSCTENGSSISYDGSTPSGVDGPSGCGNGFWTLGQAGSLACPILTILAVN